MNQRGFTLLELAIVLVIIGLIAGGIIGGKELIQNAERRSFIKRISDYKTSILGFRDKFDTLPGDVRDFKSYYSACVDAAPYYCNGNGNHLVELGPLEHMRVYEHLAYAGFITGKYDGSQIVNIDLLAPLEPYTQEYLYFNYDLAYGHLFGLFLGERAAGTGMTAQDVYQLDKKMDDGNGKQGKFFIKTNDDPACLSDYTAGTYDLTADARYCYINIQYD